MTGLGHGRKTQSEHNESGCPSIADVRADIVFPPLCATCGLMHSSKRRVQIYRLLPAEADSVVMNSAIAARVTVLFLPRDASGPRSIGVENGWAVPVECAHDA